jgi:preprotein translocase subunit SecA
MMYVSANEKAVSINLHRYNMEAEERRAAYGADITYVTVGLYQLQQLTGLGFRV